MCDAGLILDGAQLTPNALPLLRSLATGIPRERSASKKPVNWGEMKGGYETATGPFVP